MQIQNSYTLVISNHPDKTSQIIEFRNIREALSSFVDHCEALGYQYREDNNGNFIAGHIGNDYSIELISNF
jgi:hypothetical protein